MKTIAATGMIHNSPGAGCQFDREPRRVTRPASHDGSAAGRVIRNRRVVRDRVHVRPDRPRARRPCTAGARAQNNARHPRRSRVSKGRAVVCRRGAGISSLPGNSLAARRYISATRTRLAKGLGPWEASPMAMRHPARLIGPSRGSTWIGSRTAEHSIRAGRRIERDLWARSIAFSVCEQALAAVAIGALRVPRRRPARVAGVGPPHWSAGPGQIGLARADRNE